MKRLFWAVLGAVFGILLFRKVTKKAEALSPSGIASSIGGLADSVRDFVDEVRDAMTDREAELRDGVGLDGRLGAKPEDF